MAILKTTDLVAGSNMLAYTNLVPYLTCGFIHNIVSDLIQDLSDLVYSLQVLDCDLLNDHTFDLIYDLPFDLNWT